MDIFGAVYDDVMQPPMTNCDQYRYVEQDLGLPYQTGKANITTGGACVLMPKGAHNHTDGSGTTARFNSLAALALDATNNIYVADTGNNAIRKVTPAGVVTTIAGSPGSVGVSLGALPGSLTAPQGIAIERSGTLLVTTENALVRIQP